MKSIFGKRSNSQNLVAEQSAALFSDAAASLSAGTLVDNLHPSASSQLVLGRIIYRPMRLAARANTYVNVEVLSTRLRIGAWL